MSTGEIVLTLETYQALKSERDSALRQRDEATRACTGDLANMRARAEAVTADNQRLREIIMATNSDALAAMTKRAEAAEQELDVWRGAHAIGQNTMASMAAERDRLRAALDGADCEHREGPGIKGCRVDSPCWRCRAEAAEAKVERYRAALEIAATDTSWEYVHKVAREALGGKYSEASDRGEAKESAEKDSEKYSAVCQAAEGQRASSAMRGHYVTEFRCVRCGARAEL